MADAKTNTANVAAGTTGTPVKAAGATAGATTAPDNGGENLVVTRDEFKALSREVNEYRTLAETQADRAAGMETALGEANRELAELRGKMQDTTDLSSKLDGIMRTLAGTDTDRFVTLGEFDRLRTDMETLTRKEITAQLTVDGSAGGEFDTGVPGFEGGLVRHILETYFSGDVRRYRTSAEAEARRRAAENPSE